MKQKLKTVCILLVVLMAFGFAGCNKKNVQPAADNIKIKNVRITNGKMNIIIGAVYLLEAQVYDIDNNLLDKPVVWSSQNAAIVKIESDGKLQGRKAGKTIVEAKVDGKSSSVEVTVAYKEQVPTNSISSTNRETGISDRAFDRDQSTCWISDVTKATDEESEWLQANYKEQREIRKVVIKFNQATEFCLPINTLIYGLTEILGEKSVLLAEKSSIESDGSLTISFSDVAYYKHYKIVFNRNAVKDIAVSEVELWSDEQLTK